MNLGEQTGRMVNLEPLDATPAPVEFEMPQTEYMAPVGPTAVDPVTGALGEHDPAFVEHA